MKTQTKAVAKKLLKNVKGSQFTDNLSNYHAFFSVYRRLTDVSRTTEKAFFISEPRHEGDTKNGFWLPKSACKFKFEEFRNGEVEVVIQFNKRYTSVEKEERALGGVSVANVLANYITERGGDVYCNA